MQRRRCAACSRLVLLFCVLTVVEPPGALEIVCRGDDLNRIAVRQADASGAAEGATALLVPLPAAAFAGNDLVTVKALQQRRAELTERGSGLQRWAVALSLEAARQTEAAKALRALEEQVFSPKP